MQLQPSLGLQDTGIGFDIREPVDVTNTSHPAAKAHDSSAASSAISAGTNATRFRQPLLAYIPQTSNGKVLVTSRNGDAALKLVGNNQNKIAVESMSEIDALKLLKLKLGNEMSETDALDLVHALDRIPLAITQAAAYISQRLRMNAKKYLKLLS